MNAVKYWSGLGAMLYYSWSVHAYAGTPATGYVMHVHLTPAMCALNSNDSKKRKCLEGYSLNIAGLYPEKISAQCQSSSSATLPLLQAKVVARVMPDEGARLHLWRSIGGCVAMNASQYFRIVINYADRLTVPNDLSHAETYQVSAAYIQQRFMKLNPQLPAKAIHFQCQQQRKMTYLTEIRVCYKPNGQYKACPAHVQSNCPSHYYIKGAY
ncbi:ribonuclease I [uncultured Acinetobacter sp.]|uniref:ribonuclease T2 family protein n=1 Tax=uncultured Acinetobacter sp. TaxID=165433 RepID=UPI00260F359A|nr:ribonuclease I [uncultured Acinetobacter sp.]